MVWCCRSGVFQGARQLSNILSKMKILGPTVICGYWWDILLWAPKVSRNTFVSMLWPLFEAIWILLLSLSAHQNESTNCMFQLITTVCRQIQKAQIDLLWAVFGGVCFVGPWWYTGLLCYFTWRRLCLTCSPCTHLGSLHVLQLSPLSKDVILCLFYKWGPVIGSTSMTLSVDKINK